MKFLLLHLYFSSLFHSRLMGQREWTVFISVSDVHYRACDVGIALVNPSDFWAIWFCCSVFSYFFLWPDGLRISSTGFLFLFLNFADARLSDYFGALLTGNYFIILHISLFSLDFRSSILTFGSRAVRFSLEYCLEWFAITARLSSNGCAFLMCEDTHAT